METLVRVWALTSERGWNRLKLFVAALSCCWKNKENYVGIGQPGPTT